MRIPTHRDRPVADPDQAMTPMIDVVFNLLIFFVCASVGQVKESVLATELRGTSEFSPVPRAQRPLLGEVRVRLVRGDGGRTEAELNGNRIADPADLERTLRALAEAAEEIPVVLDVAPDVPLGDVVRTYDACRAARFRNVQFAVGPGRPAASKPPTDSP